MTISENIDKEIQQMIEEKCLTCPRLYDDCDPEVLTDKKECPNA